MSRIHPQYVVDAEGKPQSVLLEISEFEELLECAQDVLDAQEIERSREEPCISLSQLKAQREARESGHTWKPHQRDLGR